MEKAILSGILGAGLIAAVGSGACGGGGTGAAGTGGTTGTTTSSHTTTTTATASTGTGGGGLPSCAMAAGLALGTSQSGDLATGAADYYVFAGKAGQAVDIYTKAQGAAPNAAFDPTWIDTVVTLFDANNKQIGENNDGVPRNDNDSELITVLPADGTYCVRVEECWSWASNPKSSCQGKAAKDNTPYTVGVNLLDPAKLGIVEDAEGTGNAPTPITYAPIKGNTGYYLSIVFGKYTDAADVDVFSFTTPPGAVSVPPDERSVVRFYLLPAGASGNGSTTPAGKITLIDAADPAKKPIAQLSGTDYQGYAELWPPVDLTRQYQVSVEHPQGSTGMNDFYVMLHGPGTSNIVEKSEAANDTIAGAEAPLKSTQTGFHYYVDGDLVTDADVDHWKVPVGMSSQISVSCAAQRGGSGVRGFRVDILDADMPSTVVGTITETATLDAVTGYQPIPAGVTLLAVKMSTTLPHDPGVQSSFYHCGIHFK